MYQRRRTVFGFNGSGAAQRSLQIERRRRDVDKGHTRNAVRHRRTRRRRRPETLLETGRISISVYPKDTNIVYATIEHANGGVYRSNDKGETWTRVAEIAAVPRPMYFSKLRVDPNNDQRLWLPA